MYELCKQLKEAGFKQSGNGGYTRDYSIDSQPLIYIPTLSELIEACGDDFTDLCRKENFETNSKLVWVSDFMDYTGRMIEGSTPEESVAKLWLELNKK